MVLNSSGEQPNVNIHCVFYYDIPILYCRMMLIVRFAQSYQGTRRHFWYLRGTLGPGALDITWLCWNTQTEVCNCVCICVYIYIDIDLHMYLRTYTVNTPKIMYTNPGLLVVLRSSPGSSLFGLVLGEDVPGRVANMTKCSQTSMSAAENRWRYNML